jgi:hypothetical protein
MRVFTAVALSLLVATQSPVLSAQASPYIPLDDPRLPALEHLIALGDVSDPSPLVRPFRRVDAIRVIDSALASLELNRAVPARHVPDTVLLRTLRAAWSEDTAEARWELEGRGGVQAYKYGRRDDLHPGGPSRIKPYADLRLQAAFGHLLLVSRPALEPRLINDPDWPGRKNLDVTGRHIEGYLSAQFKWARLYYGQMDQNWGPVGVPGIGLSHYGYPRTSLGVEIGNEKLKLQAQAATLADVSDSLDRVYHRYFFAHRLSARVSPRFTIGLWETVVLSGRDRSFDGRYRNPVTLLLLANQYGLGDDGNVIVGLDLHWKVGQRTTLMGQFALDDFQYQSSGGERFPNRYAFTLSATGPLRGRVAWRGTYTQASSLAFRAQDSLESFVDQGVGLGRGYGGNDQVSLTATAPVTSRWLVSPELTLLRQGEGSLLEPAPQQPEASDTPTLFVGTVERTWRVALGLTGQHGPFALRASGGVHYIQNADHVDGRSRTRLVGQLQATLGLGRQGRL